MIIEMFDVIYVCTQVPASSQICHDLDKRKESCLAHLRPCANQDDLIKAQKVENRMYPNKASKISFYRNSFYRNIASKNV